MQNSDVLLVLGSRLCLRQVSYNWNAFARHAYKIQVDVDAAELNKPTVKPDLAVHCDARVFLDEMQRAAGRGARSTGRAHAGWLRWCRERVERYPVVQPKQRECRGEAINPYHFMDTLWRKLADDDVVVCGDATACIVTFQTARIQAGPAAVLQLRQRLDGLRPAGRGRGGRGPAAASASSAWPATAASR